MCFVFIIFLSIVLFNINNKDADHHCIYAEHAKDFKRVEDGPLRDIN